MSESNQSKSSGNHQTGPSSELIAEFNVISKKVDDFMLDIERKHNTKILISYSVMTNEGIGGTASTMNPMFALGAANALVLEMNKRYLESLRGDIGGPCQHQFIPPLVNDERPN